MPTLLDRAARPLMRRGLLSPPVPPVALAQRAQPRTAPEPEAKIGTALFRYPQRRGVLPEQARAFADTNEWCNAAISRLVSRVARAERMVVPIDPARPYSAELQARLTYLIENPNPRGDSFRSFIEPVLKDLLTLGKGGWEYVPNWRGWPVAMYPFDAASMSIEPDWDGSNPREPRYYWTPTPRQSIPLRNDEATLLVFSPSTYRSDGLSPIDTLKASIEADAAGNEFVRTMLNRYPPPGWLELGQAAGRRQVDAVTAKLQTDVLGRGGMLVTGGLPDAKFTNLWAGNSRDNELMAWSLYFAKKIAAVFLMSPQELGITMDINKATGEVQQDLTDESGYENLLSHVEEGYNRELVGKFGTPEVINLRFEFRHLTLARRRAHAELAMKLTGGVPFTLLNEARAITNAPPLELGNAVYASTMSGPVAFIGDDAPAYRRQRADEAAAQMAAQAQQGGEPSPDQTTTPDKQPGQPATGEQDATAANKPPAGAAA